MSEAETKHLRKKLNAFYDWMAEEINLGHMDLEKTPECFDRARYKLEKESADTHTIGSHCGFCKKAFKEGEEKVTENHIMFFHKSICKDGQDAYEELKGQ